MTPPGMRAVWGVLSPPRRWWAFVLLFAVSLPAVTPRLYASDEIQHFAYLRSLWFDHDLSFENEYRYFYDRDIARAHGFHETFLELTSETGRRLNFATIGCAILWAPFYGVADLTARLLRRAGSSIAADGFSRPYIAAVAYGSAVYAFLAVLLSVFVARRLVGSGHVAGFIVWLGTPLLFYMYLAPGMSHACSAFVVAAFVATWLVVRERWSRRGLVALGALAALMGMVREQDLFFALGPTLDYLLVRARDARRTDRVPATVRVKDLLAAAAVFLLCYQPQAWAYITLNGRLGPARVVSDKMIWTAPHAVEVLLSPQHGLLFWTPLVALCLAGLVQLIVRPPGASDDALPARRLAICLLAMFAAQVYVSGSVDTWTLAGSFGQRRFVGTTVVLVVGLSALLQGKERDGGAERWWRLGRVGVAALCVWWNLALMAQFGAGMMDRQRLDPVRNAYNAFVVVPQSLPDLGYRYLFNRSSFYRPSTREAFPDR
jgi:hypothetical protein